MLTVIQTALQRNALARSYRNMSRRQVSLRKGDRKFVKAWKWPSEVEDFLKEQSVGFTIHNTLQADYQG